MKINRSLVAAVLIAITSAACSASPTGPTPSDATNNRIPLLGSGVGG